VCGSILSDSLKCSRKVEEHGGHEKESHEKKCREEAEARKGD